MNNETIQKLADKGLISKELLAETDLIDEEDVADELREEDPEAEPYVSTITIVDTLWEMLVVVFLWGLLAELGGAFFVKDGIGYSFGVLIGTALAALSVAHMTWCINRSLEYGKGAKAKVVAWSLIRYFAIVGVFALMIFGKIANPLSAFLALMGLKVSAYLQPLTHRIMEKRR